MNPSEVNQKTKHPMDAPLQCNVGNPSFAKGIVGDHGMFLLALLLILVGVLKPLSQAFG